jgi:2,3-bisphosphoglycerate-dependent phosphoglycerate mutase
MQLYLIRHGQSTNNALKDPSQRICDPPLSELGKQEARLLAHFLAANQRQTGSQASDGHSLTKLYCSPFWRALQTVQPVAEMLGLVPEVWVGIHEYGGVFLDMGGVLGTVGFPGKTRSEMAAEFPGFVLPADVTDAGWWTGGFEPREAAIARTRRVADRIRCWANTDERIALISHGDLLDGLLKELLGAPSDATVYFHLQNASISRLDFIQDGFILLRYMNRVEHLSCA